MEDCKKIFVISNEDYAKYFSNGMGGELEDVFKRISQRALMVRKPVIPVLRHLDKVKKYTETKKPTFETSKTGHIFGKKSYTSLYVQLELEVEVKVVA